MLNFNVQLPVYRNTVIQIKSTNFQGTLVMLFSRANYLLNHASRFIYKTTPNIGGLRSDIAFTKLSVYRNCLSYAGTLSPS